MATLSTALSFARAQLQNDSNGLNDTNGIIFANEAVFDFHRQLAKNGVDASQIQETYVPTVTVPATGNGSTFTYPSDMLALKTIEVNYTNTNAQDYQLALQVDVANLPGQVPFSWLRTNGERSSPQFDDRGDWYEIFPSFRAGDNLTNAIRLFYYLKPTEFTSTSDTISYPLSLDYRILGWRIASNYLYSLYNFAGGDAFNAKYQEKVREYTTTLARGSQQPIQATPITWTGWQF